MNEFFIQNREIADREIEEFIKLIEPIVNNGLKNNRNPTFFEATTEMAFQVFKNNSVDFAVIEVGLGGRLDATNVINPIVSIITKIGFDH
ncbi:folylpolyglutamate synthase, partial [mine drainage metagenome]